ncbi:SWI/SNF and RSC complex subunit Ssr3 [Histomonas meleagridis]|uniref:SWI/SNF and RSC complex subunit Ssr3 n=1 Tax=Histomonas meleagridis TaxID=135588 RepID=UPI00355A987F|nr:SWI/SNF and RSC complex subunit Ssr3 [Histomonas meleagridis]KAH0800818.1 SWI/SNF and RSC complex subunit Ssr3 [Histomonas meleagridis]
MEAKLALLSKPCSIDDEKAKSEVHSLSEECQKQGYYISLLQFLKDRFSLEKNSFNNIKKLDKEPLSVLVSSKVEPFVGNSFRFFITMFHQKCSNILSSYFDKISIDLGLDHFEWNRSPECLEIDGLEYIINSPSFPLTYTCVLYPSFPLTYYSVSDELKPVVGFSAESFAKIVLTVSDYIASHSLIDDGIIHCDDCLRNAFQADEISLGQLPNLVRQNLLPLQPVRLTFNFSQQNPRHNVFLTLPDLIDLATPIQPLLNPELNTSLAKALTQMEYIELLSAVARNPFEAIEAEIAGHATLCELSDENNSKGPSASVEELNAARRSTPFYWQSWVADHAPKYLEENKLIHERYLKPQKPRNRKK